MRLPTSTCSLRRPLLLLLLLLPGPAAASSELFRDDFEGPSVWTFTSACTTSLGWEIGTTQFPPEPFSPAGPHTLQFTRMGTIPNGHHCGEAVSPAIDLSGTAAPDLRFALAWDQEGGCIYDVLRLEVRDASSGAVLHDRCLSDGAQPATWQHVALALDPAWGSVRIAFTLDTIDDINGSESGSFIDDVRVVDAPCAATLHCPGALRAGGLPRAELVASGSTSLAANDARLEGARFPMNTFAALFAGDYADYLPAGDGLRCIGAFGSVRLAVAPTRDLGRPQWTLDFSSAVLVPLATAGSPLFVQAIYRDGASVNFSDALQFDLCP